MRTIAIALSLLVLPAPAVADPCARGDAATSGKGVRAIDWCNHDYGLFALKKGRAELHEYADLGGPHDTSIWRLHHIAYGDVDRDGRTDAVVVIEESWIGTNGNGTETWTVRVFGAKGGALASLDAAGEVTRVRVKKGAIVLDVDLRGRASRQTWRWDRKARALRQAK